LVIYACNPSTWLADAGKSRVLGQPGLHSDAYLKKQNQLALGLTPVILATQEAEIRRIGVHSQLGQTVHETLSRKYPSQKGLVEWLKV
jgi:hypothetical protein